ncbi:MAG TPA: DsbA family protein, partial [Armatimonadota bacterium]|nr:DsbA family protein [Armatimonadota bacterium]
RRYAEDLGLDREQFQREMTEGRCAARVGDDVRSGEESGVRGTPTFFINGRRHESKFDLPALANEIYAEPGVGDL